MQPFRPSFLLSAVAAGLLAASTAFAGNVHREAPDAVQPEARYLIYLHGYYVEKHGSDSTYRYDDILAALANRGFEVIGREREERGVRHHAKWVRDQVDALQKAGVPAANITVGEHSKGGMIALLASTTLGSSEIRYAIMAACGPEGTRFARAYEKFAERDAALLKGRFVIAWDKSDDVAGDCNLAMKKADVPYRNITFDTGEGHRLFYTPRSIWLDAIETFAKQE